MYSLNNLVKTKTKKKRVGRGNASGKGTYSTRGMNGQGQRKSPNVKRGFEGGQMSFIMRVPKLKGFRSPNKIKYQIIKISKLENIKTGTEITLDVLKNEKLVSNVKTPAKIVGVKSFTLKPKFTLGKDVKCTKTLNPIFGVKEEKQESSNE